MGGRARLQLRIHAGFLLVAFSGLCLAAFLVDRNVQRVTVSMVEERLSNQALMLGQLTASALFGPLDDSDSGLNDDVRRLGTAVHSHLSLISLDGRVIADSESLTPLALPSEKGSAEVLSATTSGRGIAVRDAANGARMFVAEAIVRDGKILGLARSSLPMAAVMTEVEAVRKRMLWGAVLAALLAVVLAFVISSRIVRPVRDLTEAARRIEAGDLDTKISVPPGDEISDLADAFQRMTRSLQGTIAKLDSRNQDMRLVLDNVSDGLLVINRDGTIGSERSAVLERWFGTVMPGTLFWDYLAGGNTRMAHMLELGWDAVREEILPLPVTLAQMPRRLTLNERIYELAYEPIFVDNALAQALVVVSDITERVEAERAIAEQQDFVNVIDSLLNDRRGLLEFVAEADGLLTRLTVGQSDIVEAQRSIHTLRGNASMCGLASFAEACRAIEARMHDTGEAADPADLAGLQARWTRFCFRLSTLTGGKALPTIEIDELEWAELRRAIERDAPRTELTRMIHDLRFEPAEKCLGRLAAHAKVLAARMGKGQPAVVVEAGRIRLDPERWRQFLGSLSHVVRNAIDHGLESPDERRAVGKPEAGRISLSARASANTVTIEISDDGRGIDWSALQARAGSPLGRICGREELLFSHGVSTRTAVSEHSGRGVGLSAVRAALDALGGRVQVTSEHGKGTTFRFSVPATAPLARSTHEN